MKKFEEGQKWLNRKGEVVKIVSITSSSKWPIQGSDGKMYTKNGRYFTAVESDEDLVELVVGNIEDVSAVVDTTPDLDFKVGQKWCRRDGKVVEITNILQDHNYPIITNTGTYTLKGELVKGQTRYNDLVALFIEDIEDIPVTKDVEDIPVTEDVEDIPVTDEVEVQPLTTSQFVELNDAEVVELVKGQSISAAMCSKQEVSPSFATSMSRLLEQMTNEIKRYNINMLEATRTIEELSQVNFNVTTLICKVKALEEEVNKLKD